MLLIAFTLLILPCVIIAAPTVTGREASPTSHVLRHCSSSSYGRCSNWNPFQCRITEIITHTVVQHHTSTVYVAVEIGTGHPTATLPYDISGYEARVSYTSPLHEHSTRCIPRDLVTKSPQTYETPLGVSTSTFPEMTTVGIRDPDCVSYVNQVQHPSRTSSDQVVSIWSASSHQKEHPTGVASLWGKKHNGHKDWPRPTGIVSIWEGAGMIIEPSASIAKPHHEHKHSDVDTEELSWDSRPQCFKRLQYTYTATFDDLHVPYIPKPYNGLFFSEHFSVFEPSLVYGNYTAPSPPFAAQSYPSRSARITSPTPFNLMSMYVGCEYGQACLIRIRGWSPYRISPSAEMQVRVTHDTQNWTFVKFSSFGFNQVILLEFDVLDLTTGTKDTLGLTLDQIMFSKEIYEVQDCFD